MPIIKAIIAIIFLIIPALACGQGGGKAEYKWEKITDAAAYEQGYNYPVFITDAGMLALNDGGWISKDGKSWTDTGLPRSGLNSAFQKYVQFKGAVYALGTMEGNIERMKLGSRIAKTVDGKKWEVVAESSNLPERVFYAAAVFKDKIWIFGGMKNGEEFADTWNSADGVNWQKAADGLPWGKRQNLKAVVFKEKLFLIGDNDVWVSEDGINWSQVTAKMAHHPVFTSGYSLAVFDGKIWLAGINRNNTFHSGLLYSENGRDWKEMKAPWSPRGAVAVWVYGDKMFLTGGKYSYVEKEETKFVYSNDVWAMSRKRE